MYSLFDNEKGDHLAAGLNSQQKQDALKSGVDYVVNHLDKNVNPDNLKKMNMGETIAFLEGHQIVIDKHEEEIIMMNSSEIPRWVRSMY